MDEFLKESIRKRDNFLKDHPELQSFQRDLDISLSGIENPILRIFIIMRKISKNMEKINKSFKKDNVNFKDERSKVK